MPDKKKTWADRIQDIMGTATAPMKDLGENIQQGKPWFEYGPGPLEEGPRAGVQRWVNEGRYSLNNRTPSEEPGASPPPQFDIQNFAGAGTQPTRLVDMTQTAPGETPSKLPHATPGPGAMFDSGAARPPAAFSTEDKNAQTQTTSAQPTVSTTGQPQSQQPRNRYIDMLMAGPEAQREAEQQANIIETIRGTPGTSTGTHDRNAPSNTFGYFNPNNPRAKEYSDKIGAITGMDRDVALGLHGINAPIQGNLAQEGIRQFGAQAAAKAAAQAGKFGITVTEANPVTGEPAKVIRHNEKTGEYTVKDLNTEGLDDGEMQKIETFTEKYNANPDSFSEEEKKSFWLNLTPQGRKIFAEILGFTGK